jgi:signal transduction histidine kinase
LRLDVRRVDLAQMCTAVRDVFQATVSNLNLRLTLKVSRGLTCTGDAGRLQQALYQLTRNALTASPVGAEIVITAARHRGVFELSVSDEGPGIAKHIKEKIGSPFLHDTRGQRPRSGIGMGLAITRIIAELHGGQLRIRDRRPRGTIATLAIPVQSAHARRRGC